MGCDIHLRVQVKAPKRVEKITRSDGTEGEINTEFYYKGWRSMEDKIVNRWWSQEDSFEERHIIDSWYDSRNYDVFAILADVRNERTPVPEFLAAMIGSNPMFHDSRGTGFNPISQPKGFPSELGDLVPFKEPTEDVGSYNTADGFYMGDHSHSHLTLTELLADDAYWNQTTVHQGIVSPAEYLKWKEHGQPESWPKGVGGGSVRVVSNAEMDLMINRGEVDATDRGFMSGGNVYTKVEWETTYQESVGEHFWEFVERLKKLCVEWAEGDTDRVRIVFGFDS